jgi:hypothetical protein
MDEYDDYEPFGIDDNDDWALMSAGHGTDEDYGLSSDFDDYGSMIGGDSDLGGEW